MTPQNLFVAVVGLCLMNGLVSPALPVMMALHPVWLPEMLPPTNEIVFYGASLMVSTGTLPDGAILQPEDDYTGIVVVLPNGLTPTDVELDVSTTELPVRVVQGDQVISQTPGSSD